MLNFFKKMQKTNENSQFFCSICPRKLSSLAHFNKHMTTIHKVKDFICDYDGKHFNTKDKLRLHIYQHRKCFNLKCNVCGKDYKTNQSMRKHLRTHFQKHQCQHCGKVFGHKRLLLNHITAIHEELQDVQCKCEYFKIIIELNLIYFYFSLHSTIFEHNNPRQSHQTRP